MKYGNLFASSLILALSMLPLQAHSASETDHADHGKAELKKGYKGKVELSPRLKELLLEEMNLIQEGMAKLAPAIAQGDAKTVAEVATNMKNSYILAKKLDEKTRQELHHSLPEGFVKMDHEFHDFAGMMARSAEGGSWNVIPYLHYRLLEGCLNCHALYATERFPEIAGKGTKHEAMMRSHYNKHAEEMEKKGTAEQTAPVSKEALCAKMSEEDGGCCAGKKGPDGAAMEDCPMGAEGGCCAQMKSHDGKHGMEGADHEMMKEDCPLAKTGDCPMMKEEGAAAPEGDTHAGH